MLHRDSDEPENLLEVLQDKGFCDTGLPSSKLGMLQSELNRLDKEMQVEIARNRKLKSQCLQAMGSAAVLSSVAQSLMGLTLRVAFNSWRKIYVKLRADYEIQGLQQHLARLEYEEELRLHQRDSLLRGKAQVFLKQLDLEHAEELKLHQRENAQIFQQYQELERELRVEQHRSSQLEQKLKERLKVLDALKLEFNVTFTESQNLAYRIDAEHQSILRREMIAKEREEEHSLREELASLHDQGRRCQQRCVEVRAETARKRAEAEALTHLQSQDREIEELSLRLKSAEECLLTFERGLSRHSRSHPVIPVVSRAPNHEGKKFIGLDRHDCGGRYAAWDWL